MDIGEINAYDEQTLWPGEDWMGYACYNHQFHKVCE